MAETATSLSVTDLDEKLSQRETLAQTFVLKRLEKLEHGQLRVVMPDGDDGFYLNGPKPWQDYAGCLARPAGE